MEKPHARIKSVPEDFVVDEEPAYPASGTGDHLFLHVKKRGLTTMDAVARLAEALGAPRRDVGVPGLKDKIAVTTQWLSFPAPPGSLVETKARALEPTADLEVLAITRHENKLRTGHLAKNRFTLRLRDVARDKIDQVKAAFLRLGETGVPNAFGAQRFGRQGDNVERALAFLSGKERGPRDVRARKFLFSSLQSHVFNAVLEERETDGTWNVPILGDLLKLESGGMFVCTDVQTDTERARQGELGPSGPMFGVKMRSPEHDALALETRVFSRLMGEGFDLGPTKPLGEGTRRPLVLRVQDLHVTLEEFGDAPAAHGASAAPETPKPAEQRANLLVKFVLAKGAYATTVLSRVVTAEEGSPEAAPESPAGQEDADSFAL